MERWEAQGLLPIFKTSARFQTDPEQLDVSGSKTEEEDGLVVPRGLYEYIQLVVTALKYLERRKDLLSMLKGAEVRVHRIADHFKSLKRVPMDWKFDRALVFKYRPSDVKKLGEEGEDDFALSDDERGLFND